MDTNNVVVEVKRGNAVSNTKVAFAESKIDVFANIPIKGTEKTVEKTLRKRVESWNKTVGTEETDPAITYAKRMLEDAQAEYNKQVSYYINATFCADQIVTDLIIATSKTDGAEFFTPEYLAKLDIYKIPNGTILDTLQKCKSFVSALYAAAYKAHMDEIKDGTGIEVVVAECKNQIKNNDNIWMSTKWQNMSFRAKCNFLANILFQNWIPGAKITATYTHTECVEVLRRLGVNCRNSRLNRKGNNPKIGLIPIEGYTRDNAVDVNFYHEYAVNAKPLSKEESADVMSRPFTPLPTNEEPTNRKTSKRKTTK